MIFRPFNLAKSNMGLKIFVDPEGMIQRGELTVESAESLPFYKSDHGEIVRIRETGYEPVDEMSSLEEDLYEEETPEM